MEEKDRFIKIKSLKIRNYRSFGNEEQIFDFKPASKKPIAIVGYNNAGKTNLMNAILYTLGLKWVSIDTFTLDDFHYKNIDNKPEMLLEADSSSEVKFDDGKNPASLKGFHRLDVFLDKDKTILGSKITSLNSLEPQINRNGEEYEDKNYGAFGANKYFQITYINFHDIKDAINTKKTSWGNSRSFLAKHINKTVEADPILNNNKAEFIKSAKDKSNLDKFIKQIKNNLKINLRESKCEVEFNLPDYEDIFREMLFKIGLNGDKERLIPIDHFGDGYISMFVMAVIQAIAEENEKDKCLFLFEEPESFLHENHQEYFYKRVLCGLAEKGHQVIYTTHSDKMVDITSPETLIRLEFDKDKKQTIKTFPSETNKVNPLNPKENKDIPSEFNSYIKNIEPNLNKILFSDKVLLVEGPNDLLVYNYLIKKKAEELQNNTSKADPVKLAETHLNFNNIVIIPHHGKHTAYLLAALCKYLGVDYYLINDWDFEATELNIEEIGKFDLEKELKGSELYTSQIDTKKGMITTNWKLIKSAENGQIHFNVKKLESVIGYYNKENKDTKEDKNPMKIWKTIKDKYKTASDIGVDIFPESLERFLLLKENEKEKDSVSTLLSEIPF